MAFKTENRKIADIFQRVAIYYVPRYQRDYVWKKVNWKELWTDLQFTLENDHKIPWSHFLGTIVLSRDKEKDNGLDLYEIIDGQQRLTTLYLLLIAIYKNFKRLLNDDNDSLCKFMYETLLTSLTTTSNRKLVIDNELYNNDLKIILDAATEQESINSRNNLYKAFTYFDNELSNKSAEDLERLLKKVQNVNVVEIISEEDEEIYNIFEVLNARGQQLNQIELLKNHVMKYIQPRKEEFIDKAKEKWCNIFNNIVDTGDPDYLIQHFTKCYIEKKAENKESIYRLIKEEIPIDELNDFLKKLEKFSYVYKEVIKEPSNNDAINYFRIKNYRQIRSLLCAIVLKNKEEVISNTTQEESLDLIKGIFLVFNVIQQTSNKTDSIIRTASYKIYHCKYETEYKILFSEFIRDVMKCLSNRDVKKMFETNHSFKYSNVESSLKKNGPLVKYILIQLYKKTQSDTVLDANNLTIEHLESDDGSFENSSIWNLTLTTSDINADRLKNKDIVKKVQILKKESTIKENQKLENYVINGIFDFNKRKTDIIDALFDDVFLINPNVFHINENDIEEYKDIEKLLKKHEDLELLDLLKKYGKNFKIKLEREPSYTHLKDRWNRYNVE